MMFKKIFSFLAVFLLLTVLALIVFRNQILKISLEDFAHKNFKVECKIENVNLWFNCLAVKGLKLNSKDFDVNVKNAIIKFKFQKGAPVYVNEFDVSDAVIKVKSLEGLTQGLSKKKTTKSVLPTYFPPIQLNLQNINIDLKSKTFDFISSFSLIAEIGSDKIFLNDAIISNLKISSQDFELTSLTLKKFNKNKYIIKIPTLRIKDKNFTSFFIPVKAKVNQLVLPKAKNAFLGALGCMSAKLDFTRYDNFCFTANFWDASFEKIMDIFASEDAAFKGLFDGSLRGCIKAFQVETLEAGFQNKGNGFINIKKESSLAFLKPYLNKSSYDALIDNFKNYEYNIGIISAKNEKDALSVSLDFTSETMGRRNIIINFHNIFGGKK